MDCKIYRTELIGYIQGTLPGDSMTRIREHLERCPDCLAFARYLEATLAVIRIEKEIEPDPFLATRIEGMIQNPQVRTVRTFTSLKLVPAIGFSMIILAGVIGGFGIGKLITPGHPSETAFTNELRMEIDDLMQEPIETFLLEL